MKEKNKKQKQVSSFSWKTRFANQMEYPTPIFMFFIVLFAILISGLVVLSVIYWWSPSCMNDDICTFNSHGYTLQNVFLTLLFITEVFFVFTLFWIKRKKKESIWHYTLMMKLYSLLFSITIGVVSFVFVIPLSWAISKFIVHLPKIVILAILHVWKPALFIVAIATIVGVWYLINTGLAKLFGSQDE